MATRSLYLLEEVGLHYRINISAGDQFKPDFLSISPNNKISPIVDRQPVDGCAPIGLFKSGEILMYLAEKTGKLLSKGLRARSHATVAVFGRWRASV